MNLPLFIARRMARPSQEKRPSVMVRIATIAVALSLSVMIISIAVIMGFKSELSRKVSGLARHAELCDMRSIHSLEPYPIARDTLIEELLLQDPNAIRIEPYAWRGGIIKTQEGMEGLLLKGIDSTYQTDFLEGILLEGALPRLAGATRSKELLLSESLARKLLIEVGDKVELLFIRQGERPRRDRFKVSGLYGSGMEEMDQGVAYTDLRNIQRLLDWAPDQVAGYEITLRSLQHAEEYTLKLNERLLYAESEICNNLVARSTLQRYPTIFDWLRTHDVNAVVILTIMLTVALFNMISVLLILVLERTRMIGLLKSLGMSNSSLQKIFLYRALFIILEGLFWGNLVGVGCSLIQKYGHVIKLNSAGYLLSEVPIALDWGWLLAVNIGTTAAILLLLTLPAYIVSYIRPESSIRYE
uniref:ABC transporter permease n=1 Tax=Alistipes sp. TaxID=1872444 RepID=UPI004056C5E8